MTAPRSRKESVHYDKYMVQLKGRGSPCEFCEMNPNSPQFMKETKYFKLIRNTFPYSLWDGHGVADHLLVLPIVHASSLNDLPNAAGLDYLALISEYEKQGYNVYARAPQSKTKSVVHQHTHLIKPSDKTKRVLIFSKRPYFRFVR